MAGRTWFFAADGKQEGPCDEADFQALIARGAIAADTLVWTDGMAGWQKAGEIPGLLSGDPASIVLPPPGPPVDADAIGAPMALETGVWPLFGRALLLVIGNLLVIPAPWVMTGLYRWFVPRLRVPGRPDLGFTGQPGDIWFVFIILALCSYAGFVEDVLSYVLMPVQAYLSWMAFRWVVRNISSEGRPLGLSFEGSPWAYVGWNLLLYVSIISIIGWAWVLVAWFRWTCRNIAGTRRAIVFNASGWDVLWRSVLFALCAFLLIPIPWALRWYATWWVSQIALVEPA